MLMRYRGGGIGHQHLREFTRNLEREATRNDCPLPRYNDEGEVISAVIDKATGKGKRKEVEMDAEDLQDLSESEEEVDLGELESEGNQEFSDSSDENLEYDLDSDYSYDYEDD